MDGPVGPAQPSAEFSVTQLVLLFFQDAVLAQPAGAPVAQPRGTVPRATKQLAQVRATPPSHRPRGRPCSELRWTICFKPKVVGLLLLPSFGGGEVVKCTWSSVGPRTSQNILTTHPLRTLVVGIHWVSGKP